METVILYDANGEAIVKPQPVAKRWLWRGMVLLMAFGIAYAVLEIIAVSHPKKPSAGMSIEWRGSTPEAPDRLENKLGDPILHVDPIICEESINGAAKHDVKCIHPPSDLPCARHRDNCVFDF